MNELSLPKTKLFFKEGKLIKTGQGGSIVATFEGSKIKAVRIEEVKLYGTAILFASIFFALAVVAKLYIASAGWSWAATVICLGVVGFSILMVNGRNIVIETEDGTVSYPIADQFEEADGFVLSIRPILENVSESEA